VGSDRFCRVGELQAVSDLAVLQQIVMLRRIVLFVLEHRERAVEIARMADGEFVGVADLHRQHHVEAQGEGERKTRGARLPLAHHAAAHVAETDDAEQRQQAEAPPLLGVESGLSSLNQAAGRGAETTGK
jgi:hypothetical protein